MCSRPGLHPDDVVNALTIDVEDYHSIISRWWFDADASPSAAVVANTERMLQMLDEFNTRATFFVLGEVAETFPELVRRIAAAGHELGIHGHKHLWVDRLSPGRFRSEVQRSKQFIEDVTGREVLGHRAPAFSIRLKMTWAFEVLRQQGLRYDSSVYPIRSRRYGDPSAPLAPFEVNVDGGSIWEIPPATLQFVHRRWAVGGGGHLRHFPYLLNHWALRRINRSRPVVVYAHPYELETGKGRPADPNWPAGKRRRYRLFTYLQYRNRGTMQVKLRRLLTDFRFDRICDVYGQLFDSPPSTRSWTS